MKGVLNFKGVERTLISFRLPHRRRIDTNGYSCSLPRDSFFYVSFLAEEGDDFFMQWMCSKNIAHGGVKGFWYDGEMVKLFLLPKRKAELRQKKLKMH